MFHLRRNQVVGFTSKMFEKHLWKSDILSKYAGHRQLVFTSKMFEKHLWKSDIFSKDAGLETLVENELIISLER